jgi:hypothetical protein
MLFLNQQPPLHKLPTIDESRIEEHNSNNPWKQAPNKIWEGATLADAKKLATSAFASHSNLARCTLDDSVSLPESFDVRTQWPKCKLPVRNMKNTCGASYALALASAFAERQCIANNADKATPLSAQELLSCDVTNQGCKGGHLNNSLDYMKTKGIVTEECLPYKADTDSTKCEDMCQNPQRERMDGYCILYGEEDIKREIFKNGPVVSTSHLHVDFLTYKSGIYTKNEEVPKFSGFTTLKIVGWGVESGNENEPGTYV